MNYFSPVSASLRRGAGGCLVFLVGLLAAAPLAAQAQTGAVGIGTTTPAASAALDVSSTSKGLLPPRLSQAQRDAIASPAAGLTIYNTSTGVLNTWDGTKWVAALADTTPALATFAFMGTAQTYVVPAGVTALQVDLAGAMGGYTYNTNTGQGLGGRVQATLAVTPGQVLTVYVGGAGTNANAGSGGYNGGGSAVFGDGGGGGASDIRLGGTALANRVLVAGGGGGGADEGAGGAGGGLTGGAGAAGTAGSGGLGGSQSAAGTGGAGSGSYAAGNGGSGATGGNGTFSNGAGAGGGGGGYFGGGSGGGFSGGGGGSSYAGAGTSAVAHTQGVRSGDGYVRLLPVAYASLPAPFLDASNIAGVIRNQTSPQLGANFNIEGNGTIGGNSTVAGNVGIGTSSPVAKLHVSGNLRADLASGAFTLNNFAPSNGTVLLGNFTGAATSAPQLRFEGVGNSFMDIGQDAAGAFVVEGNDQARLTVQNAGNVGIGTTQPTQKLDVNGQLRVRGLSGTDTRLPVVLPDGTLGVSAPVFSSAANTATPIPAGATGTVGTGRNPTSVAVSGLRAYVVSEGSGSSVLQVFDVSNPASPVALGTVGTALQPKGVAVSGTTAYVVGGSSGLLQAYNVANPPARCCWAASTPPTAAPATWS
ncbi:glycine-rich protein [Hymenobacter sp. M29]|uniref:receptor protein-tyrosine kinase n=1 Tax=Hymenobacter mellowenesis TaxID=3063995 RepID=A0ABT9AKX0_9BACT|nr:glycine-rich protein [Hymenobacter sp. M29]MDO7849816.1 glycine-rich protein [Hymenobacter sp. M29]